MYDFIYINNTSVAIAYTRSVVFLAGIDQIFTLLIKAASLL